MSFDWISWLGELVKTFGDLIPQRVLIEQGKAGVKFKGMHTVIPLQPGRYWFIPFFSKIDTMYVNHQTIHLAEQFLTSKDGKTLKIEGTIQFKIDDVVKALVNCYEVETQIDDEAMAIICDYITSHNIADLNDTDKIRRELTSKMRGRLEEYGVKIIRAQLTSVASGKPLLLIGKVNETITHV